MQKIGYHGTAQDLRNENEAYMRRLTEMLQNEIEQANDKELAILRGLMQTATKEYRKEIKIS